MNKKGFVLLFTMVLSSIILAIAMGITSVALREVKLSISGKDSDDAFYAADTGVECALFYDKDIFVGDAFPSQTFGQMTCGNSPIYPIGNTDGWIFSVFGVGSSGNSCALVTVAKYPVDDGTGSGPYTRIVSKGYNVRDNSVDDCSGSSSNSVERQLEVTY